MFKYFDVSSSGFYKWMKDKNIDGKYNELLLEKIQSIYDDSFNNFGAGRIRAMIEIETGRNYNIKTIQRYMTKLDIKSEIRRKRKGQTRKNHSYKKIPNLIENNFTSDKPIQKIFSDTTIFFVNNQQYILCIVLDIFNNEIISFSIGKNKKFSLVKLTLEKIRIDPNQGTILHTDNGAEYITNDSLSYYKFRGIIISTSRPKTPTENRPSEYVIGVLKSEYIKRINIDSKDKTVENCIKSYIDRYNKITIQKPSHWDKWQTPEGKRKDYENNHEVDSSLK